jgi:hypothetical protein
MASRQEYNTCVARGMRGKKLSTEERRLEFCIVAKTCSGKAKDREEAKILCSQPKEPKPPKATTRAKKGLSCEEDMLRTAECVVEHIDMNLASNINSVGTAVANALIECRCQSPSPQ